MARTRRWGARGSVPPELPALFAALADRFPSGFTAGDVAAQIDDPDDLVDAGDAELTRLLKAAGFWRPATGYSVGNWLARFADRPAEGYVLRRGGIVRGYRRYRVEVAP